MYMMDAVNVLMKAAEYIELALEAGEKRLARGKPSGAIDFGSQIDAVAEAKLWLDTIYGVIGALGTRIDSKGEDFYDALVHEAVFHCDYSAYGPERSWRNTLEDFFNNVTVLLECPENVMKFALVLGEWWACYFHLKTAVVYLREIEHEGRPIPEIIQRIETLIGRMIFKRVDFAAGLVEHGMDDYHIDTLKEMDMAFTRKAYYAQYLAKAVDEKSIDVTRDTRKLNDATQEDIQKVYRNERERYYQHSDDTLNGLFGKKVEETKDD